MNYNPCDRHRRSIRLPEYDYSQLGIYFVTLCTYQRQCLFGEIHGGKMYLNQVGKLVVQEWVNSSKIRQEIELDEWIIMPNYLHGIVIITDEGVNLENQRANIGVRGQGLEGQGLEGQGLRAQALRPYGGMGGNGENRNPYLRLLGVLKLLLLNELGEFVNNLILLSGNAISMNQLSAMNDN